MRDFAIGVKRDTVEGMGAMKISFSEFVVKKNNRKTHLLDGKEKKKSAVLFTKRAFLDG